MAACSRYSVRGVPGIPRNILSQFQLRLAGLSTWFKTGNSKTILHYNKKKCTERCGSYRKRAETSCKAGVTGGWL
jgi:hypothetical protein